MVLASDDLRSPDYKDHLARRVEELRAELKEKDPYLLADRTDSKFLDDGSGKGEFQFLFWGREMALSFPEFIVRDLETGKQPGTFEQTLLAYYFNISDGTPEAGSWIAYSELPDGKWYAQAYQGYTGIELARAFKDDLPAFELAATKLGGRKESLGSSAFAFRVLPRISLLAVCWLGDEDFPTSYKVLFDASIYHHLTTDGCAIVGSALTRKLIKAIS